MARKNARQKRKNERKVKHKTFDEAMAELKRLRLNNWRAGRPERNRGLEIYEVRGGFLIGHNKEPRQRTRIWEYFSEGQRSL